MDIPDRFKITKDDIIIVSIGDENHPPTDDQLKRAIRDFSKEFKKSGIRFKELFILPYYIKISAIFEKKKCKCGQEFIVLSEDFINKNIVDNL